MKLTKLKFVFFYTLTVKILLSNLLLSTGTILFYAVSEAYQDKPFISGGGGLFQYGGANSQFAGSHSQVGGAYSQFGGPHSQFGGPHSQFAEAIDNSKKNQHALYFVC